MSVRAYKVKKIIYADEPTFNCWHDDWLIDVASNQDEYTGDGGTLFFYEEDVRKELKEKQLELKANSDESKEGEELRGKIYILENILKDMVDGAVRYVCF